MTIEKKGMILIRRGVDDEEGGECEQEEVRGGLSRE